MRRLAWTFVLFLAIFMLVAVAESKATITGWTETRQTVWFENVIPNHQYSVYWYAYHYPGDPFPYALGEGGPESNRWGTLKASVSLSDLAQQYEGGEGPVYSVRVCLLEPPAYNEVACTPYSYVGYVPLSLWDYFG